MIHSQDICREVMRIMPDSQCFWFGSSAFEDTLVFRLTPFKKTIFIIRNCSYYDQLGCLRKSVKRYLSDVLAAYKKRDYKCS